MARLRIAAFALLALTCEPCDLLAQAPSRDETLASLMQADFAVPDAPAFKLVNADPSTILRPQTVRDLTAAFAGFRTQNGALSLPRAFAVEFSPGLLLRSGTLTVGSYEAQKLLYSLRLSLATRRDTTPSAPTQLALGVRLTMHNEADMRTDASYDQRLAVTPLTQQINQVYVDARRRQGGVDAIVLSPEEQKRIQDIYAEIRRRWERRYWNADIVDVAFAIRSMAQDSSGVHTRIEQVAFWGTWGKRLGSYGQLLVGVRAGANRDTVVQSTLHQSFDFAVRTYVGSNVTKGFIELQQSWLEGVNPSFLFNFGTELAISSSVWVSLAAGVQQQGGAASHAVSSFKLNTALPRL